MQLADDDDIADDEGDQGANLPMGARASLLGLRRARAYQRRGNRQFELVANEVKHTCSRRPPVVRRDNCSSLPWAEAHESRAASAMCQFDGVLVGSIPPTLAMSKAFRTLEALAQYECLEAM